MHPRSTATPSCGMLPCSVWASGGSFFYHKRCWCCACLYTHSEKSKKKRDRGNNARPRLTLCVSSRSQSSFCEQNLNQHTRTQYDGLAPPLRSGLWVVVGVPFFGGGGQATAVAAAAASRICKTVRATAATTTSRQQPLTEHGLWKKASTHNGVSFFWLVQDIIIHNVNSLRCLPQSSKGKEQHSANNNR